MSLSQPVAHVKHRNEQLHYIPISQGTQPAVAVARPPTQGASLSSQQSSSTHERGRFVPNTQSQHSTRDLSKSPNHPARALRPPDCDSDDERDYRPRTGGFIVPPRPDAPPTPPTRVVRTPNGKGVSFTHEDKNFFVQFILWEVGNDPTLAKVEIQRRLGEKVSICALSYQLLESDADNRLRTITQYRGETIGGATPTSRTRSTTPLRVWAQRNGPRVRVSDDVVPPPAPQVRTGKTQGRNPAPRSRTMNCPTGTLTQIPTPTSPPWAGIVSPGPR